MTAIGREFIAILSTNEARTLLDVAERRDWNRGEVVSVQVAQSDD